MKVPDDVLPAAARGIEQVLDKLVKEGKVKMEGDRYSLAASN
jgi:hypothetical protein